jgi:hypothetical protein
MDSIEAKVREYETIIKQQMDQIEELVADNERLTAALSALDAHGVLASIYRDPTQNVGLRLKAAIGALPVEKGKVLSMPPPIELNRRERWRIYEQWSLRREIILKIRDVPPQGWDDHLQPDNYVEPPETEGLPPVDVIETGSGFKVLTNLLPKSGQRRIVGNGNSGNDGD